MPVLKPFVLNLSDLDFILAQVTFVPLFDAQGNAIIAWNGTSAIYDAQGALLWNGAYGASSNVAGLNSAADAMGLFGRSYAATTSSTGIRDVTGANNNLLLVHAHWGEVDNPFRRTVDANYDGYLQARAATDAEAFYGARSFGLTVDQPANYTVSFDAGGAPVLGDVVDYTPRMISQLITNGGALMVLDGANHIVNWSAALYAGDLTYRAIVDASGVNTAQLVEGAAIVADHGLVADLGHVDFQKDPAAPGGGEVFIGAENPGVAPTNGWFALFGQFFDHGLDFIDKNAGKTIRIALATDDPLYGVIGPDGRPATSITITRATIAGQDANGDPTYVNHTSPFIDQSQTYGSSAAVTTLLREWVSTDNGASFHAGMSLFDGDSLAQAWNRVHPDGSAQSVNDTLPTLNELRGHIVATDRDDLTWEDVTNLRNRDGSGHVTAGATGQALLLDMNPRFDAAHLFPANDDMGRISAALSTLGATLRAGDALDMAGGVLTLHLATDLVVSTGPSSSMTITAGDYAGASALMLWVDFSDFHITTAPGAVHDAVGEILLASVGDHYIAGDGRANENFGLTAIHHVFHEEHNYQVLNLLETIRTQDAAVSPDSHEQLHRWQTDTGSGQDANGNFLNADGSIAWDELKLFNAAKLIVEMEYQHAAVDQYARTITPHIKEFVGYSSGVDPTVSLEYAQGAFRFGHSTIRETIDVIDPDGGLTGQIMSFALRTAFLNPQLFAEQGPAAIALGMSHQQMNEVDEFLTPGLTQGLLGMPLDLGAINIARGRDIGMPTLNEFRTKVGLTAYTSWSDFGQNMIHPESLAAFVAAYAFDGDLLKAQAVVGLANGTIPEGAPEALGFTFADASAFMLNTASGIGGADAFNLIDTWIGGLAEAHVPGGLLGSTFDLVFTAQIESLMDGDRFYYLTRLFGQQFGEEVNNGQFKDIVERNTGLTHLNGSIFAYADQYYDLGAADSNATPASHATEHKYGEILAANPGIGVWTDGAASPSDIQSNGSVVTIGGVQYVRDFRPDMTPDRVHTVEGTPTSGADSHEVLVGTAFNDFIHMRAGDDTAYGDGGQDIIFGDAGNDRLYGGDDADWIDSGDGADLVDGGAGDDTIFGYGSGTEIGGFDQLIGGDGNDTIWGGEGIDKLSGGGGDDTIYGEGNTDPFTRGGDGNDFIDGGSSGDNLYGDNGDDLILGGDDQDIIFGGAGDDIVRPGRPSQALGGGPDEVIGGDGYTDTGFDLMDFSDYDAAPTGISADMATQQNPAIAPDGTTPFPAWFQMEGVIGTRNNDTILGDAPVAGGDEGSTPGNNWLIGGSGADTLRGMGGNDVIVGGSIRLDSLIGAYANPYNAYDAYSGASRRTTGTIGSNGLLDAAGLQYFDKHFVEFLRTGSADFRDRVLGDGGADAAATDTAVFSGAFLDYDVYRIDLVDVHGAALTAFRIEHVRNTTGLAPDGTPVVDDGIDLVVGIENFAFSDGVRTQFEIFSEEPIGAVTMSDLTPTEGQVLTATNNLIDGNNPGQAPGTLPVSYHWEASLDGTTWTAIAGATGAAYSPTQSQVGRMLRAVGTYVDGIGRTEVVAAAATAIVGDLIIGTSTGATHNGTAGADHIDALGGSDRLNGLDGDDTLLGGAGNDTLAGGAGSDLMAGGAGNDTFIVDDLGDLVSELAGDGTDVVQTSLSSYTLGANIERLVFAGSGDFVGTGNALANQITGGAGADTLSGGGGVDTLIGGAGNDTYVISGVSATITETTTGGVDTVLALGASYTLNANVENLTRVGVGAFTGVGNTSANVMIGGASNDTLGGGGGNDDLRGGDGADTLNGDAGADTITGGIGDDLLSGGAGQDRFVFASGFGADRITGFGATAGLSQDLIDVSAMGITAANFGTRVTVTDVGADTLITFSTGETILLANVNDATAVSVADFVLSAG